MKTVKDFRIFRQEYESLYKNETRSEGKNGPVRKKKKKERDNDDRTG